MPNCIIMGTQKKKKKEYVTDSRFLFVNVCVYYVDCVFVSVESLMSKGSLSMYYSTFLLVVVMVREALIVAECKFIVDGTEIISTINI